MSAPAMTTRRPVPPPLHLASLPSPAMGSPINEKDQLPCIMITPSSPVHEYDFQIHYFKPDPINPGFFHSISSIFSTSYQITLPDSPLLPNSYGTTQRQAWSASKRFRAILMVAAFLFFIVHLFVLPTGDRDTGFFEVFSAHSGSQQIDDAVAVWEDSEDLVTTTVAAAAIKAAKATASATLEDVMSANIF